MNTPVKQIAVNVRQAAEMLGVSKTTMETMIKTGEIPYWRLHGHYGDRMIAVADLEAFVEKRKREVVIG